MLLLWVQIALLNYFGVRMVKTLFKENLLWLCFSRAHVSSKRTRWIYHHCGEQWPGSLVASLGCSPCIFSALNPVCTALSPSLLSWEGHSWLGHTGLWVVAACWQALRSSWASPLCHTGKRTLVGWVAHLTSSRVRPMLEPGPAPCTRGGRNTVLPPVCSCLVPAVQNMPEFCGFGLHCACATFKAVISFLGWYSEVWDQTWEKMIYAHLCFVKPLNWDMTCKSCTC